MASPRVLAIVMAGGEGKRLAPLTSEHSKPAVPFGGRFRIVDFALSNLINSQIQSIYLLVQYKSQSLIEHIRKAWIMSPITPRHFVTVVPPQMRGSRVWFQGTADAVYQNLNLIREFRPDVVAVFGADHIYRMDVSQMVRFHLDHDADISIATVPIALDQCPSFGIVDIDNDMRVLDFHEKPRQPKPMPGDPEHCYASMGNYLFKPAVLAEGLEEAHALELNDFGHDVIPRLLETHRVLAYDFARNRVPGIKPFEDPNYWRDVGDLEAYFDAHQDLLGHQPRFEMFNPEWPIYSGNYLGPVAKLLDARVENSIIGGGSVIGRARIRNSVIRREVIVDDDVEIEDSIIMDYNIIGRGSRLRRTIVDRHNTLAPGTHIGYDVATDRDFYFVSPGGIVVVPQGQKGSELIYDAG